jgi:hypothetical protein
MGVQRNRVQLTVSRRHLKQKPKQKPQTDLSAHGHQAYQQFHPQRVGLSGGNSNGL